jgi:glycosyltransferase involved in cell wall biosynthesis
MCAGRVRATGVLPVEDVSAYIQACDVMLQPYPGGINSRSGAVMAALAHGKPVVTTCGRFTEPVWRDDRAVTLAPDDDPGAMATLTLNLLRNADLRNDMSIRARTMYENRFHVRHTVEALLS